MAKSKTHTAHSNSAQTSASVAQIKAHIANLDRRVEQVQGLMQDGVPYLDALKVKVEFGIKETIREIFGQQSKEFQVLRKHAIDISSQSTIAKTMGILQGLIAYLEEHQQALLGKRKPSSKSALEFCADREVPPPENIPPVVTSHPESLPSPPPPHPLPQAEGASSPQTGRRVASSRTVQDRSEPFPEASQLHPPTWETSQPAPSPATGKEPLEHMIQPKTVHDPLAANPKAVQASSPAPSTADQTGRPSAAQAHASSQGPGSSDARALIRKICLRFHPVIRQLRERSENRLPYEIEDEHDVRDVLRALLYLEFDDVATEEWTPTTDQVGVQRDFFVQPGGIVIFVARTKSGLGVKEICDRWVTACQRYASHQDCKMLFGFIYDPEGRIPNPRRIESDLAARGEGRNVEIQIFPK